MKYALIFLISLPVLLIGQVSNNMTLLDQWNPAGLPTAGGVKFNDVWGYVGNDEKEYAIIGSAAYIHIIDVSNPTNIIEVDRIEGGSTTIWRDFKTYGDRIYAVSDNSSEGLIIMDASYLPDSVHITYQSRDYFDRAHNIFIDEVHGRLYVAGANTQNNGLIVLDLTGNPDAPALITKDDLRGGEYVHDLYVNDHIVYASHGWNGLYIWDYSNNDNIQLLANIATNGYNHSSWLTEDYRYLIYAEEIPSGVDMGVIDVTNLYNGDIELQHLFKFPLLAPEHNNPTPHNPYIIDTMLVVSYYDDGTQIFDIGDPLDVQPYAYYDTYANTTYVGNGNWGTYPYLPSGNIISSDIQNGLFVMNIDDYDFSNINYEPTFPEVSLTFDPDQDNCENAPVTMLASGGYRSYQWYKNGELIPNLTSAEFTTNESGTYQAIGLQGQKKVYSNILEITDPPIQTLAIRGNTLDAFPNTGMFEWYINGSKINSEAFQMSSITPSFSGYFQAKRSINNCTYISDSIYFFAPRVNNISNLDGISARYVSSSDAIELSLQSATELVLNVNLYDAVGQLLNRENIVVNGFIITNVDASQLPPGIYFVTVDNGKEQDSFKLYID